jgi:uncharacterized membrane protein
MSAPAVPPTTAPIIAPTAVFPAILPTPAPTAPPATVPIAPPFTALLVFFIVSQFEKIKQMHNIPAVVNFMTFILLSILIKIFQGRKLVNIFEPAKLKLS